MSDTETTQIADTPSFVTLGDFWALAKAGTCPFCGYFNHPESDAQVGQDTGTLYCMSCGQTWSAR